MAEDRIDSIINRPVVSKELLDTIGEVELAQQAVVNVAKEIINLNNAIGKTTGTKSFTQAQNDAALGLEKLQQAQIKTQTAAQKLDDAQKKAADNQAQRTAKQQSANSKAAASDEAAAQKTLASMVKISAQRQKDDLLYKQLTDRLAGLRESAKELGITFGTNSDIFKDAQAEVQALDARIKGLDSSLGQSQKNVGNYGSAAFSAIRQIAYILPGIGVAGILGGISEGLLTFYQTLTKGQTTLKTQTELNKAANDIYAVEVVNVKALVDEVENQNTSYERRGQLLEQLNAISPTYFGNLKNEEDVVKRLPDAYKKFDDALKITAQIQAASALITEKYKQQLQALNDPLENSDFATKYINKIADATGATTLFGTTLGLAFGEAATDSKKLGEQIDYLYGTIKTNKDKLKQAGGPVDANDLEYLQRISNNSIEANKTALQTSIDTQDKIVANDQKSYSARASALKNSANLQIQLQQLSQAQELNYLTLTEDKKAVIEAQGAAAISKIRTDLVSKQRDLQNAESKQTIDNLSAQIEIQKAADKKIIDNQSSTLEERFDAINDYYAKSKILIDARQKEAIKDAGENQKSIEAANLAAKKSTLDLDNETSADRQKVQKEVSEQLKSIYDNYLKSLSADQQAEVAQYKATNDAKLLEIEKFKTDSIKQLTDQYSKGLITTEKYNAEVETTNQLAQVKTTQQNIELYQSVVDRIKKTKDQEQALAESLGASDDEITTLQLASNKELSQANDSLTKARIAADNAVTQIVLGNAQKIAQARQAVSDLEKQIASETIQLVKTVVDGAYQKQLDALQAQSDQIDANAQTQKDAVDRSLLTDKQKADKEKVIDAQSAAAKEAIAQRENKIKFEQAKTDRIISLAQIALTTAETIFKLESQAAIATAQAAVLLSNPLTAAYAPVAFAAAAAIGAEVPFVLALGAIQAAAVLATPLPAYADGVKGHKGGLALYGEAGTELVIEPGRKPYLTDGATVGKLATGTDVISNKQLVAAMANPGKSNYITNQLNLAGFIEASHQNTQELKKAFSNQTNHHTTVTREGLRTSVRNGNAWTNYLKKNL